MALRHRNWRRARALLSAPVNTRSGNPARRFTTPSDPPRSLWCLGGSASLLPLTEHTEHSGEGPATVDVWAGAATVGEKARVRAPGILQGVRQDRKPVEGEFGVDGCGEPHYNPGTPRGIDHERFPVRVTEVEGHAIPFHPRCQM